MPSQQLVEIILKAQDQASATAKKVDDSIKGIGKSSSMLSKIPGFDTLKTKLGNVATSIDGRFGGALTRARNRISTFGNSIKSVGSSIKGRFSGAIDGVRSRLSSFGNGVKSAAGGLNFLKGAASMAVGMIGYDLVNSMMESTRASMNARQGIQAFGSRLNMSGTEVSKFQADLDKLQGTFKKVDMDVVGQQAMDMAYRLGLPKESLSQLTETSAIFTDAMARNGRSAEDATLALADAMDGEFKRLKEIGISQDDLMKNGWSGDINDKTGLLNAMNKALKDQHYDELAKSVDTLDDAWQVLSITLSNLLESILLPITPAIVGVITGITGVINGLRGAWSAIPDFGKIAIAMVAVTAAIAVVAAFIWTQYVPAWLTAATATWAALAPILPIVLAVAAVVGILVAVVYEVGKAFGWWSDIGGMLDAISAGATRLWNAFINHPDVQAMIAAISNALSTLWGYIQQAGAAIAEFFGISTGGEWDIVSTMIHNVGTSWEILKGIVMTVVTTFQQLMSGQMSLLDVIVNVGTTLWNIWFTLSSQLTMLVLQLVANLLTWAIQGGLNFLTGITTYLSQVPMRVATFLAQVLSQIISYGARWVAQGRQKASLLLNAIIAYIRQLPGRALSALLGVVSSIVSAGARWVSNAKSKASEVVSGVVNKLTELPGKISSALSDVVDAIVGPFKQAYDDVKGVVDNIISKASEVANISLPAFGGDLPMGGDLPNVSANSSVVYNANGNTVGSSESLTVDINQNVTLDLVNVPSHISTDSLISALQNREVLRALVENRDFQSIDAQVKERINYKVNRSRGI